MALSAEQEAKKKALETAYKSLPKEEAMKAHPELTRMYENEAWLKEIAENTIGDVKSRNEFMESFRQRSFRELAKGNSLPDLVKQQQTRQQAPQSSVKDLDIER